MVLKRNEDIQPGDIIVFLSTPHLVADTSARNGFGDRVARAADGWGMTIPDGGFTEVASLEDRA